MVEQPGLGFSHGMQAIGLKGVVLCCNGLKQKRQAGNFFMHCDVSKAACELRCIVESVVGWQLHADQQNARFGFLCCVDHGEQVAAHGLQWQATQTVIGAKCDDDYGRMMFTQGLWKAGQTTGSGFAADTGIDYGVRQTGRGDFFL